jgi:hypothetical protein
MAVPMEALSWLVDSDDHGLPLPNHPEDDCPGAPGIRTDGMPFACRLMKTFTRPEDHGRSSLGRDAHGPLEDQTELATWVVVLRPGRFSGSLDEAHDDFQVWRAGDLGAVQLRESTAALRRLPTGHGRETKREKCERDC